MIPIKEIDKSWTLFLDRDGVINHEKHLDYIHTWDEFIFYDGVKEALSIFAATFNRIIVVTNQRGIGKGVTKLEDLQTIHKNMKLSIEATNGRIDNIYFCPDMDDNSPNRKPNAGMGYMAKNDFPEIDFSKSIMIGNTISDMAFGRNIGAYTIFLPTTKPETDQNDHRIDLVFNSLFDFSKTLLPNA
jgi:D-glycero-D-manno-heptose 1,7-bisphosphate phosphatase